MKARHGVMYHLAPFALAALTVAAILHFDLVGRVAYAVERGRIKAGHEQLTAVDARDVAALENLSRAFTRVASVVRPSVVNVRAMSRVEAGPARLRRLFGERTPTPDLSVGMGSGVIIDHDGHIVTNNHVAGDAERIDVTLADGRRFKARVVGTDKMTDVCVIKIDADRLHPASFGDSDAVQVGDIVLAIGSPFRLDQTVSHGIISAVGRTVESLDIDYQGFLQTDAPINPGNSGGPLVNVRGEVIGINTAIATENGGYQGVGFSIPSNKVRQIAAQLIEGKKILRGYLGVQIAPVPQATAEVMGFDSPHGAEVVGHVDPDGPAGRGGIQHGDIILEVDGKKIRNHTDLTETIGSTRPGTRSRFKVWREDRFVELTVTVGEQPEGFTTRPGRFLPRRTEPEARDPEDMEDDSPLARGLAIDAAGMDVATLTPEMARRLRLKGVDHGAVVVDVTPTGDALNAGLRPGDVIVAVDKKSIHSARELRNSLTDAALGKGVRLTVRTADGSRTVHLKTK
jgi:serine protease Do